MVSQVDGTRSEISRFRIVKLHGDMDVTVDIRNNRMILIGVNGLGKTTVINILYYLLTRQLLRLLEYRFESVELTVNGKNLTVHRTDIEASGSMKRLRTLFARILPHSMLRRIQANPELLRLIAISSPDNDASWQELARETSVSPSLLREMKAILRRETYEPDLFATPDEASRLHDALGLLPSAQVLYLPTYRRIERDLESILPGLEENIQKSRARSAGTERAHIELIEFGMRDVEAMLVGIMATLKEKARSALNTLALGYLGEVIRGDATSFETELFKSLTDSMIQSIVNRVTERTILSEADLQKLRDVIDRLRGHGTPTGLQEQYVGHFFSKLAAIHQLLIKEEETISYFVQTCNSYLVEKQIHFDDQKYEITLKHDSGDGTLELRHLSSGEKQIVSLFAHVLLGAERSMIVLIDEPELSLSVLWQRRLLPDLLDTGRCEFIAAATHSPFIFDNELSEFATDLKQCLANA